MTAEIVVVDTGAGNLGSVVRALTKAGGVATVSADPEVVARASRICMPGQGHFGDSMKGLVGGLGDAVVAHVRAGKPYLGICLGLQVLFESSEEAPGVRGLGVIPGKVSRFTDRASDAAGRTLKIPHMGWNDLRSHNPLFPDGEHFYFVHSYFAEPEDPSVIAATAEHGRAFCAAIARGPLVAVQFHPEKSQAAGHLLLQRFFEGRWS